MVLIYTTTKDADAARKLAALVVERRLASCVNMWAIESCYTWEGAMKCEPEQAVLVKTMESKVQELEDLIGENHGYATPFIGTVDVRRVNRAYKEWMSTTIE